MSYVQIRSLVWGHQQNAGTANRVGELINHTGPATKGPKTPLPPPEALPGKRGPPVAGEGPKRPEPAQQGWALTGVRCPHTTYAKAAPCQSVALRAEMEGGDKPGQPCAAGQLESSTRPANLGKGRLQLHCPLPTQLCAPLTWAGGGSQATGMH